MRYAVYLDCSVAGELPFPYDIEAESADEAGEAVKQLADQECALHGEHTVLRVNAEGEGHGNIKYN